MADFYLLVCKGLLNQVSRFKLKSYQRHITQVTGHYTAHSAQRRLKLVYLFIFIYANMNILIQTYTSHNSSRKKITKTNETGYTEKERKEKNNQNNKLRSLPGKSTNIELTK